VSTPTGPASLGALRRPRSLSRDRLVILVGLAVAIALAWTYIVFQAAGVSSSSGATGMKAMGSMMEPRPWTRVDFALRWLMWAVMMGAMMLPSSAPMTLIYASVASKARAQSAAFAPVSALVAGYLSVWLAFSVGATLIQWELERAALMSSSMAVSSPLIGGAVFIAAGVYQLTPLKRGCLKACRDPAHLFARHWRPGRAGALRMGAHLGAYCLGCCWVLMALLLVGGVMNLVWIAAIATVVFVEKLIPYGDVGGRVAAAGLLAAGLLAAFGVIALS